MPIYEYQCQSCGRQEEVMQKISDPPLATCEQCGGSLKKLISAPAFQFKGEGWYVTDYARKKGGGKGETKGEGSSGDGGSKTKEGGDGGSSTGSKSEGGGEKGKSSSTGSSD